MKTKFTIYGERCSGTNYLERAMLTNFEVDFTFDYGWKHFFGFYNFEENFHDNVLFIGIVRNPIYWLNSFSKDLHHIPYENMTLQKFLFNEFYSIYRDKNEIIPEDVNYITGERYKNIFELRKVKNDYLMNVMPTKVENYILINYENLLYNYEETLTNIQERFGLKLRGNSLVKIEDYKKSFNKFTQQRQITFPRKLLRTLWSHLDAEQENKLGYFKRDDNTFFTKKYVSHLDRLVNRVSKNETNQLVIADSQFGITHEDVIQQVVEEIPTDVEEIPTDVEEIPTDVEETQENDSKIEE